MYARIIASQRWNVFETQCSVITRLEASEARFQPNLGFHFRARFDGVHAFRNNYAEREPIWMKSGAL